MSTPEKTDIFKQYPKLISRIEAVSKYLPGSELSRNIFFSKLDKTSSLENDAIKDDAIKDSKKLPGAIEKLPAAIENAISKIEQTVREMDKSDEFYLQRMLWLNKRMSMDQQDLKNVHVWMKSNASAENKDLAQELKKFEEEKTKSIADTVQKLDALEFEHKMAMKAYENAISKAVNALLRQIEMEQKKTWETPRGAGPAPLVFPPLETLDDAASVKSAGIDVDRRRLLALLQEPMPSREEYDAMAAHARNLIANKDADGARMIIEHASTMLNSTMLSTKFSADEIIEAALLLTISAQEKDFGNVAKAFEQILISRPIGWEHIEHTAPLLASLFEKSDESAAVLHEMALHYRFGKDERGIWLAQIIGHGYMTFEQSMPGVIFGVFPLLQDKRRAGELMQEFVLANDGLLDIWAEKDQGAY